jgi:iron(III) transport system permease protein
MHRPPSSTLALAILLFVVATLVVPPFLFLLQAALGGDETRPAAYGLTNFAAVLRRGGVEVWGTTIVYALASSALAIGLGVSAAWLVARTDVPFRQAATVGAFLSLAVPIIVKSIGWIMLLGPNSGVINVMLRGFVGGTEGPLNLYSLGGMIFVEGVLWTPVAFLLMLPALGAIDPTLEEAAAVAGANLLQTGRRVILPLIGPSVLAVFLLTFIRALESFEVPLLIGTPGDLHTLSTEIFDSMRESFVPRYGEASAFAVLLLLLVAGPLAIYHRVTRSAHRFAIISGKGYRPRRFELGSWRWPVGLCLLIIPLSLAAPVLIMLWASLLPSYEAPRLGDVARFTLVHYRTVWGRPDALEGLSNSAQVAFWSASAAVCLTFVAAWLVVRGKSALRFVLDALVSAPLVFPGIVLGITLLIQFLRLPFIPIYGTIWILVVAFLIKFMPYGMRFCHAGIIAIHRDLEESARVCGASAAVVLTRVVLPLAMPAVVAAWLTVFLYTIRDLSLAVLLSGPHNQVIAVVILDLWNNGEVPELAALAVLVAAGATLLGLVLMWLGRRTSALAT